MDGHFTSGGKNVNKVESGPCDFGTIFELNPNTSANKICYY